MLRNGRRALPRALSGRMRGRLRRALDELAVTIERTATIVGAGPDPAGRADRRTVRPGWSACTTPMPGRSARAASTGRSSSGTRPRSPTTTTASSWTTPSSTAPPPTARSSRPPSSGSRRRTGRVPRAVTADRGYGQPAVERDLHDLGVRTVAIPRQATTSASPQDHRAQPRLPPAGQMANRLRRTDQLPQARLRLGPHPPGRQARSRDLVRARGIRPQPGQDRRPGQLTTHPASTRSTATPPPGLSPTTFSGRSSSCVAGRQAYRSWPSYLCGLGVLRLS